MKALILAGIIGLAIFGGLTMFDTESTSRMLSKETAVDAAFTKWCQEQGKTYGTSTEHNYRKANFAHNYKVITEHNANPLKSFTMALNQFSDLSVEEFKRQYLMKVERPLDGVAPAVAKANYSYVSSIDWRQSGKVSRVKNQGQCGSCWAFSTVGSVEAWNAIENNTTPVEFSEQQLVDCAGSYGPQGCSGGWMYNAMDYFRDNGICTESSYGYTARNGYCKANQCQKSSFTISGHRMVARDSEEAMKEALSKQPVSVTVDASAFMSYSSGVIRNGTCGDSLDHGVLAVGYTDSYWIVKNSWGASWGEQGYVRLGMGNTCGMLDVAVVPY